MTARDPYLCLICNRVMVLRRCVPICAGQPDITVWGCLHCSDKQETELAVMRDAPETRTKAIAFLIISGVFWNEPRSLIITHSGLSGSSGQVPRSVESRNRPASLSVLSIRAIPSSTLKKLAGGYAQHFVS